MVVQQKCADFAPQVVCVLCVCCSHAGVCVLFMQVCVLCVCCSHAGVRAVLMYDDNYACQRMIHGLGTVFCVNNRQDGISYMQTDQSGFVYENESYVCKTGMKRMIYGTYTRTYIYIYICTHIHICNLGSPVFLPQ